MCAQEPDSGARSLSPSTDANCPGENPFAGVETAADKVPKSFLMQSPHCEGGKWCLLYVRSKSDLNITTNIILTTIHLGALL